MHKLTTANLCVAALLTALLQAGEASAQLPTEPAATQIDRAIDTVIVTGTAFKRRTFDAAYANSSVSDAQIERYAPLNTVDLLGKLAGFVSEPSGGESGNNINVRGLPITNFLFVPLLQDGLPVFQESQEDFLNADELMRVDLMTDHLEAVRGGTSPIYTSNAPGATVNFITRKGTTVPHGMVRGTIGDYGLLRFDGAWSGPIGRGWLLSMGGYYRLDDGLRKPGFTADRGGQFRVNLTRALRNGELNLYAGRLHDRTIFYLPVPLADPRAPGRSLSHLLDPRTGTLTSNDFRNVRIRTLDGTPGGAIHNEDLADGVYPRVTVVGASIDLRLVSGWTLQDKVRYTNGSVKFNSLFSLTPPDDAAAFLAGQLDRARVGFGPAVDRLAYVLANARGPGGSRVPFDPAGTDGLVIRGGWWSVDTTFSNFMNDFRLSREWTGIGPGSHTLTGGLYFSDYTFRQSRLFNSMLMEMRDRPRALDLIALDRAGNTLGSVTENGFLDYGDNSDMGGAVDGRLWALYVTDEWKLSEHCAWTAACATSRRARTVTPWSEPPGTWATRPPWPTTTWAGHPAASTGGTSISAAPRGPWAATTSSRPHSASSRATRRRFARRPCPTSIWGRASLRPSTRTSGRPKPAPSIASGAAPPTSPCSGTASSPCATRRSRSIPMARWCRPTSSAPPRTMASNSRAIGAWCPSWN
jgi:outer membrane receptor protein involved in Fe transport